MTHLTIWSRLRALAVASCSALLLCALSVADGVAADQQDSNQLSHELQMPIYTWGVPGSGCLGVVVAVHGLAMHAGTFSVLAENLASQKFLVVAPDLRGYGHWVTGTGELKADLRVDYDQSFCDLVKLVTRLKSNYPGLPLFLVGESLGADLAIRTSAACPEKVAGLILSSPAIKRRTFVNRHVIADVPRACSGPNKPLDLAPYIRICASEDPRIVQGMLDDPLVRKNLNSFDLLKSQIFMMSTRKQIAKVPANVPILIIQGDADRLLKSNAVVVLLANLKSKDRTVRWFHNRGHILLETAFVQPDTLQTVKGWLVAYVQNKAALKSAQVSQPLAPE